MRKLTVKSGPAAGRSMPIEADLVIGRSDADLTIDDVELSRRHVLLRPVDDGVEIQDLGSTNGTVVNGTRISEPVTVTSGASIELGDTRIAVEIEPAPAPARAEPDAAPDTAGRPRSRLVIALAVLVAVAALALVLAFALGGDSDEAEVRPLEAGLRAPSLARLDSFQVAGVITGEPLGEVAVIAQRRLGGNLRPGGPPVSVRGSMLVTGPDGVLSLNYSGELRVDRSGRESLDARGTAANGTRDYAEVTGSFRFTGGRPDADTRIADYRLDGELEY